FDIVRGYAWPRTYTGRAVRNRFLERWDGREDALAGALEAESAGYRAAAAGGDCETAVVWSGEVADLIKSVEGAAALVAQISADAEARLRGGAALVHP
ncbi:MAG: NAD(P)H-dependent flavin oxidoreductase, partial [Casimicrobiaceae bacterium]